MKLASFSALFSCISLLGLTACSTTTPPSHAEHAHSTPTHNQEPEHDNNSHATAWHYHNGGAEEWGNIAGNEGCKTGLEQSPINISKVRLSKEKAPKSEFGISNMEVENNGHTIVYTPKDATNKTLFGDEYYTLKQFHYHTPSEHQISGTHYPAELHFVHANDKGALAVIGVMLNPTADHDMIHALTNSAIGATESGHSAMIASFDLNSLLPKKTSYYGYKGSLTTPPCSERVKWFVAEQPISVSPADFRALAKLYSNNNRPIQPQHDRVVKKID